MAYLIVENSFSMKCSGFVDDYGDENAHSISFDRCNYKCEFCGFHYYKKINRYINYSIDEFRSVITDLLKSGRCFEFTGGEPTLNPRLLEDLKIVKELGGIVFLDTNAYNTNLIEQTAQMDLVDLYGISLKGLNPSEMSRRAGIKNGNKVLEKTKNLINVLSNIYDKKTIITYVCYEGFTYEQLENFSKIIDESDNVFLKINNYMIDEYDAVHDKVKPMQNDRLLELVSEFIENNSNWKDRTTIVLDRAAVEDINKVVML